MVEFQPLKFSNSPPPCRYLTLDEVQRASELLLPIKAAVDRSRQSGWFLLTGSADVMLLPGMADSPDINRADAFFKATSLHRTCRLATGKISYRACWLVDCAICRKPRAPSFSAARVVCGARNGAVWRQLVGRSAVYLVDTGASLVSVGGPSARHQRQGWRGPELRERHAGAAGAIVVKI